MGNNTFLLKEKGFISIAGFAFVAIVGILSMAMMSRMQNFMFSSERTQNRIIAFHMAESGIDSAIKQLYADQSYIGQSYTSLNTSSVKGGFSVQITTPSGALVDINDYRIILASGYSPSNASGQRGYSRRSITSYVKFKRQNFFDFGVFAKEDLQFNASASGFVDSYNSNLGNYNSSTNANSNGDVGTDSTSQDTLRLIGNVSIRGDGVVGPEGIPSDVIDIGPNASITGVQTTAPATRDDEVVTTTAPSSGSINLHGNRTLTLNSGTYHYSSISVSGSAELKINGTVTIYVDGDVDLGGNGLVNNSQIPANCRIFVAGDTVRLTGNSDFYGAIHAPNADVSNVGNADVYGALLGKTYHQTGNSDVHYDESLSAQGGNSVRGVKLLAWKEEGSSAWGTGD